jgi:hypothetical protein
MKNLHVLPTDKPSRLSILNSGKLNFGAEIMSSSNSKPQHIYITSDEEIKEGDYMYDIDGDVGKAIGSDMKEFEGNKKIILTTDQDLIKDGVQKINDEFLEWFVKNPSCENVKVEEEQINNKPGSSYSTITIYKYKIIIPKEEQKQHLIDIMRGDEELGLYEEPKQETLEEFIENGGYPTGSTQEIWEQGVREGAKWQQERMYSKEDMKQFAWECVANFLSNNVNEVEMALVEVIIDRNGKQFEKFKKK